ncbi:hypothetical protein PAE9249_01711 [Paenibacillus sp. CECT 9249]|nr:hypothetical protein [Paenibacillus sp. CECT 9249]CAH0119212.1 hypothetical protein PAE9249_01711 [Paenibacillus sp. CECT 9249]
MFGEKQEATQIKIGIVGTSAMVAKVMKVIEWFPTFLPVARMVENEQASSFLAEELADQVEVLLVSGARQHRQVKERGVAVPVHYIPVTDAALYGALFRAYRSGKLVGGISVDTLTKTMVMRALQDLDLQYADVAVYDGPNYSHPDKLEAFHKQLAAEGKSAVAFTGVEEVAEALTRSSLANEWMVPSEQDIVVTLERALLSTASRRDKESQIVVGVINVDNFNSLVMKRENEHEIQKLKLDIHRMLLEYVESLDGYLTSLGGDEFLFFTTRGVFERETGGYKTIPLAKDAKKTYGITLSLGIGFGMTGNEAGTNARKALRQAKEAGGNVCFIVREDQTLIGPLEMAEPMQTVLSPTHAELIKQAEDAGMTSSYLSKLLHQMARYGRTDYNVHELASVLQITDRSAHRLLLLWMDNGLVDIAGIEKVAKGRPRQIFRFSFLLNK